ncbi:MAG: hypothetical protein J4G09_02935 [Proteobacteria bacterium]|nr:hypothetical protein [Pseudomonadota bacterium]
MASAEDTAYPTITPADPIYACQTREPLTAPLNEVATPAIWACLAEPLRRALAELWRAHKLRNEGLPENWVSLNYGRIAINAHGWERLCAAVQARSPDQALVVPTGRWGRWLARWESRRAQRGARRLETRLSETGPRCDSTLERVRGLTLDQLDTEAVALGALSPELWVDILLPGLSGALGSGATPPPDARVEAALALEQRFTAEMGRRLAKRGILDRPAQIAYLTIGERIRALNAEAGGWVALAEERESRAMEFAELDVPNVFWGRPRLGGSVPAGMAQRPAEG